MNTSVDSEVLLFESLHVAGDKFIDHMYSKRNSMQQKI
jgi:hypothetical protein